LSTNFTIIVHGGAGHYADDEQAAALAGCRRAALSGWDILCRGGAALDAVEATIISLEDNPVFNAGTGATFNALGEVELDASIMDGAGLRAGAVAAVKRIRNPISLARKIMQDGRHVLLVGDGALRFAAEAGVRECPEETLIVERQRKHWQEQHGTVGAVALDRRGDIAAATSTGGIFDKLPGRVGDSALIGCGTYADAIAGVSCTGNGEAIIKTVLAKTAVEFVHAGHSPSEAAQQAMALLQEKTQSKGGLIIVNQQGAVGYAHATHHMPICHISSPDGQRSSVDGFTSKIYLDI
jgi:L-asparaginase / beta-aspartyl-peptidase